MNHELEKLTIMKSTGYYYEKAHWLASKKYPWEFAIKGGMTNDQIRVIIETELEKYI